MKQHQGRRPPFSLRLWLAVFGSVAVAPGCTQQQDPLAEAFAVRSRVDPNYRLALLTLERHRADQRHKEDAALYGMCAVAVSTCAGNYRDADRIGKSTLEDVQRHQDANRETAAAWGRESIKLFKGEPHERSMLAWYIGLAAYQRGEYNDARIFFAQSILAAATRDEDAADFREDFQLGHYWLGRAYQHLGQHDNARVAYQKAGQFRAHSGQDRELARLKKQRELEYRRELKAEVECYRRATQAKQPVAGVLDLSTPRMRHELPERLPDATDESSVLASARNFGEFLDPAFQQRINLIVIIELGIGPSKYLAGLQNEQDEVAPGVYKERYVDVYVDGYRAGPAFQLCDLYHQACTRGVKTRRTRQGSKAFAKEILRRLPYAGALFDYWNVSADARYVPVLPGEVHVFGAEVKPGLHTVALRCSDINGRYLPRHDTDRHFVPVRPDKETVLLLHTKENQDNAYLLEHRDGTASR